VSPAEEPFAYLRQDFLSPVTFLGDWNLRDLEAMHRQPSRVPKRLTPVLTTPGIDEPSPRRFLHHVICMDSSVGSEYCGGP
jgi:hypothetical protein